MQDPARLTGLGSALALLSSLITVAALAEDDPQGLRVSCDDGARSGAAVLVVDPRPDHSHGMWVLTALHVLHDCGSIDVARTSCAGKDTPVLTAPWSSERPVEVVLFRGLDVAAIVVPPDAQAEFAAAKVLPFKLPTQAAPLPRRRGDMELLAKAGANVCPLIPLQRRDAVTALAVFGALGKSGYERLLGSLSGTTELVSYQSTAVKGTSGGPVRVEQRPHEVIAVHLGGQDAAVQWGVRVDSALLLRHLDQDGPDAYARLDTDHPQLSIDDYAEPMHLTRPEPENVAKLDLALHNDSFGASLESSTPIDPFGAYAITPVLSWSHLWFSPGFASLDSAIGTRVSVGGNFGKYRGKMSGPDFEEQPRKGTARVPFAGAFLQLDAELHLARSSPVHYVVSAGLRGGPVHQRNVEGGGATRFVFGPAISGHLSWGWLDGISVITRLRISVDRIPVTVCEPSCEGGPAADGQIWDAWAGVSMGVELEP